MDHNEIMHRTLVTTGGFILAVDNRDPVNPTLVTSVGTINPDYAEVLTAAILLYRTANETLLYLESLVEYLESKNCDEAVSSVSAIQGTLHTAMKIAREGWQENMLKPQNKR